MRIWIINVWGKRKIVIIRWTRNILKFLIKMDYLKKISFGPWKTRPYFAPIHYLMQRYLNIFLHTNWNDIFASNISKKISTLVFPSFNFVNLNLEINEIHFVICHAHIVHLRDKAWKQWHFLNNWKKLSKLIQLLGFL